MTRIREHALQGIGGTLMVALRHVGADEGIRVLLKLESERPTGGMKDLSNPAFQRAAREARP